MKYLNALVLAGLVLCGLALLIGFILGNGSLEALAAYFGWFLSAYSGVAYLVASALFLAKRGGEFWNTFYPINFVLALLGISVFGILDQRTVLVMGATALVAAGVSVVLFRAHVLDRRFAPIALLVVLGAVFAEPIFAVWKYLAVFVAVLLLATAFTALRAKTGSRGLAKSATR